MKPGLLLASAIVGGIVPAVAQNAQTSVRCIDYK
jgi:hypothetical protein